MKDKRTVRVRQLKKCRQKQNQVWQSRIYPTSRDSIQLLDYFTNKNHHHMTNSVCVEMAIKKNCNNIKSWSTMLKFSSFLCFLFTVFRLHDTGNFSSTTNPCARYDNSWKKLWTNPSCSLSRPVKTGMGFTNATALVIFKKTILLMYFQQVVWIVVNFC